MQMIKLVYLAHGWFMAYHNDDEKNLVPLIKEHVEAWRYGPVIPLVYYAVKEFYSSPIKGPILGGDEEGRNLSETEKDVIDVIIKTYGDMNGIDLSNLTHQPNTPWYKTYRGIPYKVIPNETIFKHFKILLKNVDKEK